MARFLPKHNPIMLVSTVMDMPSDVLEGNHFRLVGWLKQHNCSTCRAVLADDKTSVTVDTTLIEPFQASSTDLCQIIGEFDCLDKDCDKLFKAHIISHMESLHDLPMMKKAIQIQEYYLDLIDKEDKKQTKNESDKISSLTRETKK